MLFASYLVGKLEECNIDSCNCVFIDTHREAKAKANFGPLDRRSIFWVLRLVTRTVRFVVSLPVLLVVLRLFSMFSVLVPVAAFVGFSRLLF